jgi:hypothetical protein
MQNAEGTGNAGTDKWNNGIHSIVVLIGFTEEKLGENGFDGQRIFQCRNRTLVPVDTVRMRIDIKGLATKEAD